MKAEQQGASDLAKMSAMGSGGQHPQNIQRQLIRMFGSPPGAPGFVWCEVTTRKGKSLHPFFLPHQWLSSLHAEHPDQFASALKGPEIGANEFWNEMAGSAFVDSHPGLDPEKLPQTIPVGLYGDAGKYSKQDSLMIFTWNSLLGTGSTITKKFLCTAIRKADVVPGTYDDILNILSWSFNVMLTGLWPSIDWQGRELEPRPEYLAGGLRACLCQVRGDWEFYTSIFAFPKWNEAERMCWCCDASSHGPLSFSDCGPDAPWRATRHTHESYLEMLAARGQQVPVLFQKALGMRLEMVAIDTLHTVDLGIALHIGGNVLMECCRAKAFCDGNIDANIAELNEVIKEWYRRNPKVSTRLKGKLTRERIQTSKSWPKLKSKAAETRHLAPFFLELSRKHLDAKRVAVCQLLCEFYSLIHAQGMFLDEPAKERLPLIGRRMCGMFAALSREAFAKGQKGWKMTPKVHLTLHLCEWQATTYGNPRFSWTYSDEDLVGTMVEVAQSCHTSTVVPTAMVKWLVVAFGHE